jgi:hypothetical protein
MEQLKNKNHLTPGLSDVLATRLAVKVAIPVPPVVAVVMTVMAMTAEVLPTRASILDTAATTRMAVKMAIPEAQCWRMVMMVAVVMTVAGMMADR